MIRNSADMPFTVARGRAGPPQVTPIYRSGWSGPPPSHCRYLAAPIRGPLSGPFFSQSNRGAVPRPPPPHYFHQQLRPKPSSPPEQQHHPQQQPLPEKKIKKILVNYNRNGGARQESKPILPPAEHQLQDIWTFWYLRFEKNFSWEHSQTELGDCRTVEEFWGIFDQIVPLTEVHHGCNYSLFKKGIRPIWEDAMNRHGGRFVFTITKDERTYKKFADRMWLEFAMAVVGNILHGVSDQICGIIGGNRNNLIKIAVWTRDCQKKAEVIQIGKYFKKIANYYDPVPYEAHMDSQQRPSNKTLFRI